LRGLSGLLKAAAQENPRLIGQVLMMEPGVSTQALIERLNAQAGSRSQDVRYVRGKPEVLWLLEVTTAVIRPLWRDQGVYLITGGAGGLGMLLAKTIAARV